MFYFSVAAIPIISESSNLELSMSEHLILKGSTLDITCQAPEFQPFNFTWYKDGDEYIGGTIEQNGTSSRLIIDSVKQSDAGSYSCKVTNSSGVTDNSSNVMVIIGSKYLCFGF